MSAEQYFKSPCRSCGGNIAFPASAAGANVNCPHCGQQTTLLARQTAEAPDSPAETTAAITPPAPTPAPVARAATPVARPASAVPTARPATAIPIAKPAVATAAKPAKAATAAGAIAAKQAAPAKKDAGPKTVPDKDDPYAELERLARRVRCPQCTAKIDPEETICPKCGAVFSKNLRRFRRYGGIAILLLAVTVPLLWPKGVWPRKIKPVAPGKEGLAVLGQAWKKGTDNNLSFVVGAVTNHSDRALYSAKVEVELINRNGTVVGTTVDQIQILDPHKVWNFKALVIDPEAVNAQPAKVTWLR